MSKNCDIRSEASPVYTSSLILSMFAPTLLSFLVSLRLSSHIYSHALLILVKFNCPMLSLKAFEKFQQQNKQECIPVGCVPPACWPYPSMHCRGYLPRGVYLPGGCTCQGVYLTRGCTCQKGVYLPAGCTCQGGVLAQEGVHAGGVTCPGEVPAQVLSPVNRMTDRCKNITLRVQLPTEANFLKAFNVNIILNCQLCFICGKLE